MVDDRKLKILEAIIHNYILNAEPVGSRTLSKKYNLGISSATIRNEMSDLEELGYLVQPYTSAGRVPSDRAYRLYVNSLLQPKKVASLEKEHIRKNLFKGLGEVEKVISNSAKILSQLTNYTSLAIAPQMKSDRLKHIELVPIDEHMILVVMVTNSGIVKNTPIRVDNSITQSQLYKISNFLNEKLKGQYIKDLGKDLQDELVDQMYTFKNVLKDVIPIINNTLDSIEAIEVYANGVTNIFNFPEYKDIEEAKSFISFIENKKSVIDLMTENICEDINVTIGKENNFEQIKKCSLITATYKLNGKTIGKIGVIGPTRMEYSKAIPIVKVMVSNLNDILEKYFLL